MMIRSPELSPLNFGAVGDGIALDTTALQNAIDAAAARGGGTIHITAGRYLTGTLFFHDNISLELDPGAVLLGSQNPADYPVAPYRWEGAEQLTYSPLLTGSGLKNIAITGRGTIDGQGGPWWRAFEENTLAYPRPRLIGFTDCQNILIEGLTLTNSPAWTVNPVNCENVNVRGVTIINPPDSPNTDGINPDSCRGVRISDCFVSVGDDCITLKSGTQHELPQRRRACRDIAITNCILERGHGGVVIGSEMSGDVHNVVISNCIFIGTDRGIRIKSRRGRGGRIENVRASNLIMEGVHCPITINLFYNCNGAKGDQIVSDKSPRPLDIGTPVLRSIHFSHISAVDVKIAAGFLYGLPELPLDDVDLDDISISLSPTAEPGYAEMADDIPMLFKAGLFIRNARNIRLNRVRIYGQEGEAFDLDESVEVKITP